MGVPSLFAYLNRKYGQVTFLHKNSKIKSKFNSILYFDFNCLIHPIVNDIIDNTLNSPEFRSRSPEFLFPLIFSKIRDYTDYIISLVDNPSLVYIVFDGVAPRAKMNQQRSRRFLSIKNNKPERRAFFDTNCISPGTEFMNQLSLFLHSYYDNSDHCHGSHCKIVISDTLDSGEAEHKIMRLIRNNNNNEITHIIYGLDADLIMLSLCSTKNIKLLRENTIGKLPITTEFLLYHISGVKKCIITEIMSLIESNLINHINKYIVIKDIIYLTFFIGNDFMPALNGLEINKNGIDYIISIYTELFNKYEGKFRITNGIKINYNFLIEFLVELNTILSIDNGSSTLQKNYYSKVHSTNDTDTLINKMCFSYIKTSLWTFQYYQNWCPSFSWFYSYHYPPLLSDLIIYLQSNNVSPKFDNASPVSPEIQLLCILPKQSKHLVKENLHCVFEKFPEMYPDDYEIDLNGKKYEWQSVVKLPFLSIENIIKYLDNGGF
jgi:5'-3' exonuclease